MAKEKQTDIAVSEDNLTDLFTEEKLLKANLLNSGKVSAEKAEAVKSAKLKSSCLAVVLSAFLGLFGVGSFYLGYWRRGICKIVCNVLLPIALGMVFLFWLAPTYHSYSVAATETSEIVAYETLNGYIAKYSSTYNDLLALFNSVDGNNDTLKNVHENVTKYEDLQTDLDNTTKIFESVFTNEFSQSVKSLCALDEIVTKEDYKFIKEKLSSSDSALINRLDKLTDTEQINDLVYTVENLTGILSTEKIDNVVEDLNELSDKLDGLIALRNTDDLFEAAESINQNTPVTDRLLENVQSMTKIIAVLENLQGFKNDVALKYNALGQATGDDNSLSHAVAEKIASLDSEKDAELIAKLTALKNKLDDLSLPDIEEVETPLTEFLASDDSETAYEFTAKLSGELKNALASLNELAVGTVEDGEQVNLYSKFAKADLIYNMTHQASLICEFAKEYEALVAEYELFSNLPELDAKLDFVNVSSDYIGNLNDAYKLIEVRHKLYDYTDGEAVLFDTEISDIEQVMASLNKANTIGESYTANSSNLSSEWNVDSKIITMLFIILLAIDGAVIVAYWIGEVFKDRAKCLRDNDKKIKSLLQ